MLAYLLKYTTFLDNSSKNLTSIQYHFSQANASQDSFNNILLGLFFCIII
jgi:hypothetical protein